MPVSHPRRQLRSFCIILAAAITLSGPSARRACGQAPASAPTSAPTGQVIEGLVINHFGAGISGATVRVERIDAAEGVPALATGTTSKTGDIRVQLPTPVSGSVRVRIRKEGFASFVQELDLSDETQPPWVDATLQGAGMLTGLVRDLLLNEPVKNAHVVCANGGQDFETDTDAQGRFTFDTISYGPATLNVSAKGFGMVRKMLNITSDDTNADIELGPERRIEFRIITDDEKPAPDVRVEVVARPAGQFLVENTGPDGRIVLHGIGPDAEELLLRLNGPHYIHSPEFNVRIPLLSEAETDEAAAEPPASLPAIRHELIVHIAGKVQGTVTDLKSGEPIVGVRVVAGRELTGDEPVAWTSLDGTYELEGLPPGVNIVSFLHTDYAPSIHEVHLDQEQTATLNLKLATGRPIAGKVVDAGGKPLDMVFISGDNWQGYSTAGLRTITDKDGRFSIPNAPNGEIEFSFVKPGFGPPLRQTLTAAKEDYVITLKVTEPSDEDGPGQPRMSRLEVGKTVPDMTLIDLNGTTYKLSALRGKYVFLDFWATWCGPCMREVENVKALHEAMKDRPDFVLIGVSLDTDRDELKKTIESEKMPWPQVFGPKSGGREAFEILNGVGIPYTCLIGPDGKILAQELRGPQLAAQVKEIIAKSAASRPAASKPAI